MSPGATGTVLPARRLREAVIAASAALVPFGLEIIIVASNMRRFGGLSTPSFAPPIWLAVPVWVGVMVLSAWAFFRVLCRPDYLPDRPGAIRAIGMMLGLGVVWCWAFFDGRHPTLGLLTGAMTAAAAGLTAWRFTIVDRKAGLLLLPSVLLILFAALIELSISVRSG
jgi:tryptophan-rich sensory protein